MERDTERKLQGKSIRYFNSHAHVERDMLVICGLYRNINFNSHAHVERDETAKIVDSCIDDFNSHAHVERDATKNTTI